MTVKVIPLKVAGSAGSTPLAMIKIPTMTAMIATANNHPYTEERPPLIAVGILNSSMEANHTSWPSTLRRLEKW